MPCAQSESNKQQRPQRQLERERRARVASHRQSGLSELAAAQRHANNNDDDDDDDDELRRLDAMRHRR